MSEHPEGAVPPADPTGDPTGAADTTAAAAPDATPDATAAAPESSGPAAQGDTPDALGVVEEQERVPEEESTIAEPGEALDGLLPALAATGHDGVDDALATLDDMAATSVHDHVEVFDAVHEELRRTLDQATQE